MNKKKLENIKVSDETKETKQITEYPYERLLIETDVIQSLPLQTKYILASAIRDKQKNIESTYENYKNLCEAFGLTVLTKKRVEDLLVELQYLSSKTDEQLNKNLKVACMNCGKIVPIIKAKDMDLIDGTWICSDCRIKLDFYHNIRKKRMKLHSDMEELITNARQNQEYPISRMELLGILELVKLRYYKC